MHQDEDQEYYNDDDDDYNYDHPSLNPYYNYYKFHIEPDSPLSKWIGDIVKNFIEYGEDYSTINIPEFPSKLFPVNSYFSGTGKEQSFQYLGNNYDNAKIWKKKYFVIDKIHIQYKMHIQSYPSYFLQQPTYYKGLFDILN